MATFAKSTFAAASYAAFRPSYPPSLYNAITSYHRGPRGLVVDLGAGTGIATREMAKFFDRAILTDPSATMISQAQAKSPADSNLSFQQASAENLPFLQDNSVDCVIAAQAAHWFDFKKLWPELARVLRKDGTVACWGYKDHVFVDFPEANEVMMEYAYGMDREKLGSYWEQPGRRYLQEKLRVVQPSEDAFYDVTRTEYEPGTKGRNSGEGTLFVEKTVSVRDCKEYVRTWSSYHGWKEAHPDQEPRSKGGKGDVVDQMFDEMAEKTEHFRNEDNMLNIEWGSGLVMARKR